MTQQFAVGDRVVIQRFHRDIDGREGTVTEAKFSATRAYPYRVRLDGDPNWDGMGGRLFTANELIAVSKPTPAPQFAPGDRVVYTIPETYLGYPGKNSAVRPAGSKGTVTEVYGSEAANVDWDDYGVVNADVAFLAHAPKPTHKHPEGLYRIGSRGERVFIAHAPEPGAYEIAYLDGRTRSGNVPINSDMTDVIVGSYTLIAAAPVPQTKETQ